MVSIGVDIGTTTICACVLDTNTGEVLKTWTKKHGFIAAPSPKTKIQSVNEIESMISAILNEITTNYDDIACLGLTGQMHGILYLDSHGSPVSPLITWQDEEEMRSCPEKPFHMLKTIPVDRISVCNRLRRRNTFL